jgi:hypothetical protein
MGHQNLPSTKTGKIKLLLVQALLPSSVESYSRLRLLQSGELTF